MTLQVNHLAPYLLTTLLLPVLIESKATVVATSSSANRLARLDLDDLNGSRRYSTGNAYAVAKLANTMFTVELSFPLRPVAFGGHPGLGIVAFGDEPVHLDLLCVEVALYVSASSETVRTCSMTSAISARIDLR